MHNPKNTRVALLAGGSSSEREISLASGDGAAAALAEAGYTVVRLDPAKEEDLAQLSLAKEVLSQVDLSEKKELSRVNLSKKENLSRVNPKAFDVAFICLHGEGGEDGQIQSILERAHLPYTCSGVQASANCMDKSVTKKFYKAAGIPTPESLELQKRDVLERGTSGISETASKIIQAFGQQCVIKVVNGGSSIGVYIVEGLAEIKNTLEKAFSESDTLLVERYIAGREMTDVVLEVCESARKVCGDAQGGNLPQGIRSFSPKEGRQFEPQESRQFVPREAQPPQETQPPQATYSQQEGRQFVPQETHSQQEDRQFVLQEIPRFVPQALPIIEIIPTNSSYDYDSKYSPGGSQHICPAELPDSTAKAIQDLAVRAHVALGCSGVSRTDFILDDAGQPWALETNTIPGMTKTSLLPDAAAAAGVSFPDLCVQLIEEALCRKRVS